MSFTAFLLTLRAKQETIASSAPPPEALQTALKHFLFQQQGQRGFIRVAFFAQRKEDMTFRITVGEQGGANVVQQVLEKVLSSSTILLGQNAYQVISVDLNDSTWAGIRTWSDIVQGSSGSLMRFSFATPLLTDAQQAWADKAAPFPELVSLFVQLKLVWSALCGPVLPHDIEEMLHLSECVVSNYHLYTVPTQRGDAPMTGFLGWIEYECLARRSLCIPMLNALARFAFFTGLGFFTEEGMGTTSVTILY